MARTSGFAKKIPKNTFCKLFFAIPLCFSPNRLCRSGFPLCAIIIVEGGPPKILLLHILGAFAKNTKVERHFDTKHNGIAKKSLQKAFFGIFLPNPDPRSYFFSLCKSAHFLIKHCIFSARAKIFAPRLPGQNFRRPTFNNYYSTEWEPHRQSRFGEKLSQRNPK